MIKTKSVRFKELGLTLDDGFGHRRLDRTNLESAPRESNSRMSGDIGGSIFALCGWRWMSFPGKVDQNDGKVDQNLGQVDQKYFLVDQKIVEVDQKIRKVDQKY